MNPVARRFQRLTLAGYFALITLLAAWYGWLSPSQLPLGLVLGVMAGPLLLPLPGLFQGRVYTFAWGSMLASLYMIHAMVEIIANPADRLLASAELLISLWIVATATLYARVVAPRAKRKKG